MSKKILSSLIVAATLLSGAMAFADNTATPIKPAVKTIKTAMNLQLKEIITFSEELLKSYRSDSVQRLFETVGIEQKTQWGQMTALKATNKASQPTYVKITEDKDRKSYLTIAIGADTLYNNAVYSTIELTQNSNVAKIVTVQKKKGIIDQATQTVKTMVLEKK